jgi:predicted nuclease of restriction endonuclease-like RecB superfamily
MKTIGFPKYKDMKGKIINASEPYNVGNNFGSSYSHIQSGEYENSKGTMYFRSKWEANYALHLDFLVKQKLIKSWEFEPDRFIFESIQFGTRSYIPDFKIKENDGTISYHEVKGYMSATSKTKLKRMAKYFPNIKLVLIDEDYYKALKKQVSKLENWY